MDTLTSTVLLIGAGFTVGSGLVLALIVVPHLHSVVGYFRALDLKISALDRKISAKSEAAEARHRELVWALQSEKVLMSGTTPDTLTAKVQGLRADLNALQEDYWGEPGPTEDRQPIDLDSLPADPPASTYQPRHAAEDQPDPTPEDGPSPGPGDDPVGPGPHPESDPPAVSYQSVTDPDGQPPESDPRRRKGFDS